jgi:hypothetical protein
MTDTTTIPEPVTRVTVFHGPNLNARGVQALATVRRALLGMLGHGSITELETHSRSGWTEWSWRRGTEEPEGIRDGVLDTLAVIAPGDWEYR